MKTAIMSIKEAFQAASASLKYEDGGKLQVVTLDGIAYRVDGTFHCDEIIREIGAQKAAADG